MPIIFVLLLILFWCLIPSLEARLLSAELWAKPLFFLKQAVLLIVKEDIGMVAEVDWNLEMIIWFV